MKKYTALISTQQIKILLLCPKITTITDIPFYGISLCNLLRNLPSLRCIHRTNSCSQDRFDESASITQLTELHIRCGDVKIDHNIQSLPNLQVLILLGGHTSALITNHAIQYLATLSMTEIANY